jgi:predicted nucleic acid-binding protein
MKWLLDVDFLCALAWKNHQRHAAASRWLDAGAEIVTSPIAELGFLRVSMRAYQAGFEDAQTALSDITAMAEFLHDDVRAVDLPKCPASETTDAHLVILARRHGMKLATLDDALCRQTWAKNLAVNPL